MQELVGRNLEVPRAVFARDTARGYSDEPPNGKFWDAKVTEFDEQYAGKFTITLVDVIEVDEDTGEEKLEDFPCSLAQLKKWISEDSLLPHEARATLGQFIIPAAPRPGCFQGTFLSQDVDVHVRMNRGTARNGRGCRMPNCAAAPATPPCPRHGRSGFVLSVSGLNSVILARTVGRRRCAIARGPPAGHFLAPVMGIRRQRTGPPEDEGVARGPPAGHFGASDWRCFYPALLETGLTKSHSVSDTDCFVHCSLLLALAPP